MSDGVRERGGKPQSFKKSFGGQTSFPQRQQQGYQREDVFVPLEPNKGIGGMISGQNNNHQDLHCKPQNIEFPDVITQEAVWETTAAAEIQQTTAERTLLQKVAREKKLNENGRSEKSEDNASSKPSIMYLVLPSYAEPQKQAIRKIIADEKTKLCSNSLFKQVFANIDFNIAFANSKNVKQLIVRTKI